MLARCGLFYNPDFCCCMLYRHCSSGNSCSLCKDHFLVCVLGLACQCFLLIIDLLIIGTMYNYNISCEFDDKLLIL